jgi:hypothetical protein
MTTTMTRNVLLACLVAVALSIGSIALAHAAGDGDDDAVPAAPLAPGAAGTLLAPTAKVGAGGISVAEAIATPSPENLLVFGHLLETGDGLRLCSALLEAGPPRCGGPSLAIEGSPGVEPGPDRTTVLGRVDGGRLVVVDLSAA